MPTNEKDKPIVKVINSFGDLNVEGSVASMDFSEDAWEFGAPPPHEIYLFKLFMAKEGRSVCYTREGDESTLYTRINIELRIMDEGEYKDAVAFYTADSRIWRGKKISTMAGLLTKLYGEEAMRKQGQLSHRKQAMLLENALKKEPTLKAELDWRGAYKAPDDKWVNVANTYSDFPLDPENKGARLHSYQVTGKDGNKYTVNAQTQIQRFFAKSEQVSIKKVSNVVTANKTMPVEETPEFAEPAPKLAKATKATPTPVVVAAEEEESMGLMLE